MPALRDELVGCGALKFGDFTLTSGKKSKYYVDVKQATTIPRILKQIADSIGAKVGDAEVLAGVELGAVPILVAVALATNKPYAIIRKGERTHGTGKKIEGQSVKGKRVLIIEDVTTTGSSVVKAVELLRQEGAQVGRVETVVDRGEGGSEALRALDVRLGSLVSSQDLLAMSAGGARA
jgi:orotate phosphoribosyltransferase